jgi:hypothetical protein
VEAILAYRAGLRKPLQPTICPTFTLSVSLASVEVMVQHSNAARQSARSAAV